MRQVRCRFADCLFSRQEAGDKQPADLHLRYIHNYFKYLICTIKISSIRPFIGARDFIISRKFYRDLGFEEKELFHNMSYFGKQGFGFYLQDYAAKEWLENTMVFLEIDNVDDYWNELQALKLPEKYPGVKLVPVRTEPWGKECFVHDPAGILWHFGEFISV